MTPEIGEYVASALQTLGIVIATIVLHRTWFKNEDKDDE